MIRNKQLYAIQNKFCVPNEIFTLDLSAGELAIYLYLLYCEDRKTYQCYPSYATIARATQLSRNTVRKYVEMLVQKKLIETERTRITTKDGRRHNGSLLYTILPIKGAVDYYFEQKMFELKSSGKK